MSVSTGTWFDRDQVLYGKFSCQCVFNVVNKVYSMHQRSQLSQLKG